jgi:hypothetical protein
MHITKRVKVVAGVSALLGVVLAGGSAFTATGITLGTSAALPQFIGGTVSQDVSGTTLESVIYSYADAADGTSGSGTPAGAGDTTGETPGVGNNTEIDSVLLTFSDDNAGATVPTIVFGGTNSPYSDWTCTTIATSTPFVSTCTTTASPAYAVGVTSITVTLAPTNNAG